MGREKSFIDILTERVLQKQKRQEKPYWGDFDSSPAHLAFLLGQIPKGQTPPPKYAYPQPPRRPPPPPPEGLSSRDQEAWRFFLEHGEALRPKFSKQDLKRSFRRLARHLHPDSQTKKASNEAFFQLRRAYSQLLEISQPDEPTY